MIITLLATNIEYDTDGPGIPTTHDLPASMEVQVDLDIQVAAHTLGDIHSKPQFNSCNSQTNPI